VIAPDQHNVSGLIFW